MKTYFWTACKRRGLVMNDILEFANTGKFRKWLSNKRSAQMDAELAKGEGKQGHAPEVLQNMQDNLRKLDEMGIKAIE